ncbi:MAG: hypothetical protein KJ659_09925 [Actinobacteria bacterium]|nr:hypothetical protein [Actinomycetota bacterium]MBU1609813.1 hypothetical protein [Actinomycetota bacterium]MBU2316318.1 hypothetical protein [Actinomycetota bacterium]MBU2385794.1 hypothetical protein [Actinomycetota bacterium]
MTTAHPEGFAAFIAGERRFVAAAWRDHPDRPYFVLPDGAAHEHRERARTQLRCMFRDCRTPQITTVHRVRGRDGFRHLDGSTELHGGPEGHHHISGKAVLIDHLRRTYPHLDVIAEQGIDTQRTRIADVMVTNPATGMRMAFEVQYASLTVEEWKARSDDYRRADIPVVWLWGHTGVHLRPQRGSVARGRPAVELSPVLQAAATVQPLLWLNSELGLIGVGHQMDFWDGAERPVPARHYAADLALEPLAEFALTANGFTSPMLRTLEANEGARERRRRALEAAEAREAERRKAWQAAHPRPAWPPPNPALPDPSSVSPRPSRRKTLYVGADPYVERPPRAPIEPSPPRPEPGICTVCGEALDGVLVATTGKHLMPCRRPSSTNDR